jgi:hypothetical protein
LSRGCVCCPSEGKFSISSSQYGCDSAYIRHVISYDPLANKSGRCGLHCTLRIAYSWPDRRPSHFPPTGCADPPGCNMRQSHIFTVLSIPALARTSGLYLFQSSASSSLGAAGTVRTGADSGAVNVLEVGAKEGERRSKKRTVPSPEQVASRSG